MNLKVEIFRHSPLAENPLSGSPRNSREYSMNRIIIAEDECKGCRLCVVSCPKKCIAIGSKINKLGYQYAVFDSRQCTACGICFTICPEPGAITVIEEKEKKEP